MKKILLSSGDVMCTNWRSGIKKGKIQRTTKYWIRPGRVQVKSSFFHAVPVPSVVTCFAFFALGAMMILNRVQDEIFCMRMIERKSSLHMFTTCYRVVTV